MLATVFAFLISMLFVAGSTQISDPFLSALQFIAGVWFAIAGAITGYQAANKL